MLKYHEMRRLRELVLSFLVHLTHSELRLRSEDRTQASQTPKRRGKAEHMTPDRK